MPTDENGLPVVHPPSTRAMFSGAVIAVAIGIAILTGTGGLSKSGFIQKQMDDPGGTATTTWYVLGTTQASLAKCRSHHEAALLAAQQWYSMTLALQTACPAVVAATPDAPVGAND